MYLGTNGSKSPSVKTRKLGLVTEPTTLQVKYRLRVLSRTNSCGAVKNVEACGAVRNVEGNQVSLQDSR